MIAAPVLAIIVLASLVWALAAPSSTPNNWIEMKQQQEQPASADTPKKH